MSLILINWQIKKFYIVNQLYTSIYIPFDQELRLNHIYGIDKI